MQCVVLNHSLLFFHLSDNNLQVTQDGFFFQTSNFYEHSFIRSVEFDSF
jgi:hypothetical protein